MSSFFLPVEIVKKSTFCELLLHLLEFITDVIRPHHITKGPLFLIGIFLISDLFWGLATDDT